MNKIQKLQYIILFWNTIGYNDALSLERLYDISKDNKVTFFTSCENTVVSKFFRFVSRGNEQWRGRIMLRKLNYLVVKETLAAIYKI